MDSQIRVVVVQCDGTAETQQWQRADDGSLLDQLQAAVGGSVDVASIHPRIDAWVHDEGIFVHEPNPVATCIGVVLGDGRNLFGPVVFTGGADEVGRTLGLRLADAELLRELAEQFTGQLDVLQRLADQQRRFAASLGASTGD